MLHWLATVASLASSAVAQSTPTLVDHPIVSSVAPLYLDGADWIATHFSSSGSRGASINATVPGDILTDLQRAGRTRDPYWNVTWRDPAFIATWNEGSWEYSKTFATPPGPVGQDVLLSFDGVFMGATIELNGVRLNRTIDPIVPIVAGATDQFYRFVFPIGHLLGNAGAAPNILRVTFGSAQNEHPGTSGGRFTFSTHIDWAPGMSTTDRSGRSTFGFGLWKSIYLLPLPNHLAITQVVPHTFYAGDHPVVRLADSDHQGFVVNITLDLFSALDAAATAEISIIGSWPGADMVSRAVALTPGSNSVTLSIPANQTRSVRLWHPNGHGDQPLYNITASVTAPASDTKPVMASRRIGFRHIALVTINDTDPMIVAAAKTQEGTGAFTMMFRVNGAAVYARGGSMIPMDLLNGRLNAGAHHRLVQSAAEGKFNMMRIWGGGIYMPPAFYSACDEYGILLYHDLQFAGKAGSVTWSRQTEAEVVYQVKRLSHHPSIAMWDGCNECKTFYPWWLYTMPTVAAVDKSRPIWPGSPAGGWVTGVERLTSRPTGGRLIYNSRWPPNHVTPEFPWILETHGPYTGFMHDSVNNWTLPHALEPRLQTARGNDPSAVPTKTSPNQEGWAKSEFGANSWPSFESISPQLPADQWGMSSAAAKYRNWPVSNLITAFFGSQAGAAMKTEIGEVAFKKQLYQSLISQLLYLKTTIQAWRSTNIMLSVWWMYNELWPTGGWGSIEYGSPAPGQVLGGRWKPIHYEMRASTFNDHMATCNSAGACFVTNDSPFRFEGTATIRILNVLSGTSANLTKVSVSLPPGPKLSHWFCAGPELPPAPPPAPAPPRAAYTVFPGIPTDRSNYTKPLRGPSVSEAACEANCNDEPSCLGFTMKDKSSLSCWLYDFVPSLQSSQDVSWHQKPGTKPIPGLPPAPTPPPPQLNCTKWSATDSWNHVGCAADGSNCVLVIDVHDNPGSRVSWSTVPFHPPKRMQLPPARVAWELAQDVTGDRVNIVLSTNATALYVVLTTMAQGRFSDNAVLLEVGVPKVLQFISWNGPIGASELALLKSSLRVEHLAENIATRNLENEDVPSESLDRGMGTAVYNI